MPRRLLETAQGYEPFMRGLLDSSVPPATVAGMDLIRDASGELMVLEDNLRMPSGATYAIAVREALGAAVPTGRILGTGAALVRSATWAQILATADAVGASHG